MKQSRLLNKLDNDLRSIIEAYEKQSGILVIGINIVRSERELGISTFINVVVGNNNKTK